MTIDYDWDYGDPCKIDPERVVVSWGPGCGHAGPWVTSVYEARDLDQGPDLISGPPAPHCVVQAIWRSVLEYWG